MFEKNEDYFEDSFYSETNVPFEGVNFSLYKSSLINIFICCVILFIGFLVMFIKEDILIFKSK